MIPEAPPKIVRLPRGPFRSTTTERHRNEFSGRRNRLPGTKTKARKIPAPKRTTSLKNKKAVREKRPRKLAKPLPKGYNLSV